MKRTKQAQAAAPVYVRPILDRHQKTAERAWNKAAYRGKRAIPKPGDFDPLLLRAGLRVHCITSRAGWVVSNPGYDQLLRRHPDFDPSLPGVGWLETTYRDYRYRELTMLPRTLAALKCRQDDDRPPEEPRARLATTPTPVIEKRPELPQLELFA